MPMYDKDAYNPDLIPKIYKKEVRDLIGMAVMIGWKMHVTSAQGITIIAPGDPSPKKFHFGINGRATHSLTRLHKDITKYGDPRLLALGMETKNGNVPVEVAMNMFPMPGKEGTVEFHRPEDEPVEEPKQAHVVSEKPMLAKASAGRAYDSSIAVERKWSDGSKDYKCVQCEYTSPHRLSVRGHYQIHAKQTGKSERGPVYKAEVPEAVTYAPNKNRVAALAAYLLERLGEGLGIDGDDDVMDVARMTLTWVHSQSKSGTPLAAEREELDDSDVLNRIRALLDQGTYLKLQEQVRDMEERLAVMSTKVEQAEQFAMEQQKRADSARENLKAFTELANELSADREEATR